VASAREAGLGVGGFLARGIEADGRKVGFDLDILDTEDRVPLCRAMDAPLGPAKVALAYAGGPRVGHFLFQRGGLRAGGEALQRVLRTPPRIAVIDEVGFLELAGGGWDPWLAELVTRPPCSILMIVRDELEAAVRERYGLTTARRRRAGETMNLHDLLERE